jgi:hypothetical protein
LNSFIIQIWMLQPLGVKDLTIHMDLAWQMCNK